MEYFSVRDILGTKEDDGQSSYVRLGAMPIVQQTEWVTELMLSITTHLETHIEDSNAVGLTFVTFATKQMGPVGCIFAHKNAMHF